MALLAFVVAWCVCCKAELLNETMFRSLAHARVVIAAWAADYRL